MKCRSTSSPSIPLSQKVKVSTHAHSHLWQKICHEGLTKGMEHCLRLCFTLCMVSVILSSN